MRNSINVNLGILRSLKDEEVETMREWRNEPAVRQKMYTQHEISLEEHLNWWESTKKRADCIYFMYEYQSTPCGIAGFTSISDTNKSASWAFYASPGASRGTGSRMEYLMLEYAFNNLGLNKLYCEVISSNEPVIKLHGKFGFRIEGVFRQHRIIQDEYVDITCMGILQKEWRKQREVVLENLAKQGTR